MEDSERDRNKAMFWLNWKRSIAVYISRLKACIVLLSKLFELYFINWEIFPEEQVKLKVPDFSVEFCLDWLSAVYEAAFNAALTTTTKEGTAGSAEETSRKTHQVSGVFHQLGPRGDTGSKTLNPAEIIIKAQRQTYQQNSHISNAHAQEPQPLVSHWLLLLLRVWRWDEMVSSQALPAGMNLNATQSIDG